MGSRLRLPIRLPCTQRSPCGSEPQGDSGHAAARALRTAPARSLVPPEPAQSAGFCADRAIAATVSPLQAETALMASTAPDPRRWKALALVCAAIFMTVVDVSIVTVAIPTIGAKLHFSRDALQWVITAY